MKRVVITGMGCVSPLGNSISTMWARLQKGENAIREIQTIPLDTIPVRLAAEVLDFNAEEQGLD